MNNKIPGFQATSIIHHECTAEPICAPKPERATAGWFVVEGGAEG